MPLARALSKLGLASRTEAHALIRAGRVRVDGALATDAASLVVPEQARIAIDGVRQPGKRRRRVLLLHKPRGVVTTRRDPAGRRTVFDLLGSAGEGMVAVGRLDMASTGLLVFTNDTALANRLTDPSNEIPRRYVVTVRGRVEEETAARLGRGIDVPAASGRRERLSVQRLEIRKASSRETHLAVTLVEGKNREIRRLFDAVGHEVTRVHRVSFGEYELGDLQPSEYRELEPDKLPL